MPSFDELSTTFSGLVRDLRLIAGNADQIVPRARFIAKKLPAIREGLKTVANRDTSAALSIGTYIEDNASRSPGDPAIFFEDRVITHRELSEESNRWAHLFASRGVGKGDAIAIFVDNRPEILFAVAGAVKLGAVAAVINTKQRKHVLQHSFGLCDGLIYVVGEELWDAFDEVRADIDNAERDLVFWVSDSGDSSCPDTATDLVAAAADMPATAPDALRQVRLSDPCFYIYTSGTTGLPKASIMSHNRWVKASGAFGKVALGVVPEDRIYVPLPLYHNNALTVTWASALTAGASMILRRRFSASKFWDDVRRYRATSFCYIGELCRYLMNQPPRPDDSDNPVHKIVGNGLRPDIWKQFKERFGIDEVYEFYGASEANIAFVNVFNFDCTVGFCPAPYALVEYDIDADEPVRGPDGFMRRVGRGEVGLLIGEVSERYAFDGYTDQSASENKLLRDVFKPGDTWFNSGDLLEDQGFRHAQFVDRVGDTFRWKGENVSTNEVAEVVNGHPQVDESTVYGVQIPGTDGRCGMAALVTNVPPDQLDLASLHRRIAAELPAYARPLFLRVREALEITGTFKQKKGDLKREAYDPSQVAEPLFVLRDGGYESLTKELYQQIQAADVRF